MKVAALLIERLDPEWEGSRLHEILSHACFDSVFGQSRLGGEKFTAAEFRQFLATVERLCSDVDSNRIRYTGPYAPFGSKELIGKLRDMVRADPRALEQPGRTAAESGPTVGSSATGTPCFLLSAGVRKSDSSTRARIQVGALVQEFEVPFVFTDSPYVEFGDDLKQIARKNPGISGNLPLAVWALLDIGPMSRPLFLGRAVEWPGVEA